MSKPYFTPARGMNTASPLLFEKAWENFNTHQGILDLRITTLRTCLKATEAAIEAISQDARAMSGIHEYQDQPDDVRHSLIVARDEAARLLKGLEDFRETGSNKDLINYVGRYRRTP